MQRLALAAVVPEAPPEDLLELIGALESARALAWLGSSVALRGIGRPSKAEPFRRFVVEQLAKQPELMSLEVLRRARLQGYSGGQSALYALVPTIRPKRVRLVTRFEGLPGEFSQHDFGEIDVSFMNGTKKRIHFFASRMKYSRWACLRSWLRRRRQGPWRPLQEERALSSGTRLESKPTFQVAPPPSADVSSQ